jgi:hypothetical protein
VKKRRQPYPEPLPEHRALAEAWLRYDAGKPNEKNPEAWADDRLMDLVCRDPEAAWQVIDLMWRQASDDQTLANIAAGPVEDLLADHGEAFIDRIYLLARREPVFRKLLGAVWRNSIHEPVWQKLKSIAGPEF